MLEEVLRAINNRFDRDSGGAYYGVAEGVFTVSGGTREIDGMLAGQSFWVEGSVLNDGLHEYPPEGMADETFDGRVIALRIPRAVVELAGEIEDWCGEHAAEISSPYQSESFGGYSYSKASGGSGAPLAAWMEQFGGKLAPYRKISRDWV